MGGISKKFYAHELLRFDFENILEEAKRQEEIDTRNKDEVQLASIIFNFFSNTVIPLIISEKWVYESSLAFAEQHIQSYFNTIRLAGQLTYKYQQKLHKINQEVIDCLANLAISGKAPKADKVDLVKASDFTQLILFKKLTATELQSINNLHNRALDHEKMQLTLTLRNIRDMYEMGLPRIMFVACRAMKHQLGMKHQISDDRLLQPSDYLDWYKNNLDEKHELFPILGNQKIEKFFRVARNVGGHHTGLKWDRNKNIVILEDRSKTLEIPLLKFQPRHRYLVYFCDYGTRAILSGFCEVEKGPIANKVYQEYDKIFPSGYPSGNGRGVKPYPMN